MAETNGADMETHVDWLRSIGVEERSGISPWAGQEVDRLLAPRSWPSDLMDWYDARLWDRFGDLQAVGLRNVGALHPPTSSVNAYGEVGDEYEDLQELGLYPKSPTLIWQDEKGLTVTAETAGPGAGTLYWMDVVDAHDGFAGRLCDSISEYLVIIRALVDAGVLSLQEDPAWAAAAWIPDRIDERCPPLDTPGPIAGVPWATVGAGLPAMTNPVAPSIAELLSKGR